MKKGFILSLLMNTLLMANAQPNWEAIKTNATFNVPDASYGSPYLQSQSIPGWEDGLFMTRDGKQMFSTYLPLDAFSWLGDFVLDPECFDFAPYYRPPLLDIDTVTNIFGCDKFMQSDIIMTTREDVTVDFYPWSASNLQEAFSFDGGVHGVLKNDDTFDVFVFTKDGIGTSATDLFFMRNVSRNPTNETAIPILVSEGQEDNPHIEGINDSTLVLLFDRDRYIYYTLSYDNGENWEPETLIPTVLNDQAPYDVQPHLWHDGVDWWVYFCADNPDGVRSIYKAQQSSSGDWGNWEEPELVISPNFIIPDEGYIYGLGEPTLSTWGDLSFVVVYGNHELPDSTDVYDCDPWFMPKIDSPLSGIQSFSGTPECFSIYPIPTDEELYITLDQKIPIGSEFQVLNATGQILDRFSYEGTTVLLNTSAFQPGVYYLRLSGMFNQVQRFLVN